MIVAVHWAFGWLAVRWPALDDLLKGRSKLLVSDGRTIERSLRASQLSEEDLMEDLGTIGRIGDLARVKEARLERSGKISGLEKD